jgi:hypothetical protein
LTPQPQNPKWFDIDIDPGAGPGAGQPPPAPPSSFFVGTTSGDT